MATPSQPAARVTSNIPVPDPTVLTTQQLQREIATSREIVETKIVAVKDSLEMRLGGMDKARELVHERVDKFPSMVEDQTHRLQALHEEKFRSIAIQFLERDTRTEQTSRDSKVAVDAALQAAKEAVGEQNKSNALAIAKSEATFTKQIDQIGVLITTLQRGLDDKIDDIKTRLQTVESRISGLADSATQLNDLKLQVQALLSVRKGQGDLWGIIAGVVGLAVAIGAIIYRH
jgi:uncharacterized phage infection (PIP) family protein YhgE